MEGITGRRRRELENKVSMLVSSLDTALTSIQTTNDDRGQGDPYID